MSPSEYIYKSHNVSVLLYHFVCPAKYRKVMISKAVDITLKDVCLEIEKRYEVHFLEIGTDKNHVYFLLQSVPTKSPTQIIKILKSITAIEIFRIHPEVKTQLWGGEFWTMDILSTRSVNLEMSQQFRDMFVINGLKKITQFCTKRNSWLYFQIPRSLLRGHSFRNS